ncbi:MAG: choice-of-anchor V domain-containing protein [Sandaracinaceae bacterium]
MRRLATVILLGLAAPATASAYHVGATFRDEPGVGGGGQIFYTGSPTEHGWTCAACHIDAPELLEVRFLDDSDLLETGTYVPGQRYQIRLTMMYEDQAGELQPGERLGVSSVRSNFNGMAASVRADDVASDAGSINAGMGYLLYGRGVIASDSTQNAVTEWTFAWTAPPAGSGAITFYMGVVDGNGANAEATVTRNDPFGDDVWFGYLRVEERTGTASRWRGLPDDPEAAVSPPRRLAILRRRRIGAPGLG